MRTNQAFDVDLLEIGTKITASTTSNSFMVIYALNVDYLYTKTHQKDVLKERSFIVLNSHESLIIENKHQQNYLLTVTFYFSEIEKLINQDWRPFFTDTEFVYVSDEDKSLFNEYLFRLILDASDQSDTQQPFASIGYLVQFLECLNRLILTDATFEPSMNVGKEIDARIRKIMAHIDLHFMRKLTLQDIAKSEYLSEAYLSRLFKEETGCNFLDFVNQVRLKHATAELRQSQLPIVTIALNNGFPSAKRFNEVFKSKYGVTPHAYRKQIEPIVVPSLPVEIVTEEYRNITDEEAIQIIAQFMLTQNIKKTGENITKVHQLDVRDSQDSQDTTLVKPDNIINIGMAENGLSEDVRYQIRLLQEKVSFDYIRFFGLCDEVDQQHYIIRDKHVNNHRLFSYINEVRLKPIIVMTAECDDTLDEWKEKLRYLRRVIQGYVHFEASFKSGWFLELNLNAVTHPERTMSFYEYTHHFLKTNFTTGQLGICVSNQTKQVMNDFFRLMGQERRIQPDFLSFVYRDSAQKSYRNETEYLEFIESLDDVQHQLPEEYIDIPMFVTEWNIIARDTNLLSGTFFRSGIVMKALVELSDRVSAVGFWLNLESQTFIDEYDQQSNLSIFLHGPLKRPLFFVLTLFERVGDTIIVKTNRFIVTKRFNSYYLLFYNSYYLNPLDTAYENLWKTSQKEVVFHFKSLPKGDYLVKQFLLDSNHGGIYNQWLKAGGIKEMDTDIQEFLLQSVVPYFDMKEIYIDEGELEEHAYLEMNACYLLILNKLN